MSGEKIFIAADLHGAAEATARLLAAFEQEEGQRLLLLGDLLGGGFPSPRRKDSPPQQHSLPPVDEQLNRVADRIWAVKGNCDGGLAAALLNFPLAERLDLSLAGRRWLCTHGHLFDETCPPPLKPGSLLLCGHTHRPAWRRHGGWAYVNPGSLGLPRGGSEASYLVLQGSRLQWRDLAGRTWREIDLDKEALL